MGRSEAKAGVGCLGVAKIDRTPVVPGVSVGFPGSGITRIENITSALHGGVFSKAKRFIAIKLWKTEEPLNPMPGRASAPLGLP